jgi:bifunctional non-homologous end joining protein LigD
MFVAFDLLAEDGESLLGQSYRGRRLRLEALGLDGPHWCTTVATDDGAGLWAWACNRGLAGGLRRGLHRGDRPNAAHPAVAILTCMDARIHSAEASARSASVDAATGA